MRIASGVVTFASIQLKLGIQYQPETAADIETAILHMYSTDNPIPEENVLLDIACKIHCRVGMEPAIFFVFVS